MFKNKKVRLILIILIIFIIIYLFYSNYFKANEKKDAKIIISDFIENSNIIKDIKYKTKDIEGNEYIIMASEGEIDFSNSNILFLKKVNAFIKLKDSEDITIVSDFGKYNSENFDTIFSKNVTIQYLDNKLSGQYLDFSIERNSMLLTKDVLLENSNNILKADVIDLNITTKDTKISMFENDEKINIRSKF